jgi:pimeloyl-ACP methyl ester carboxylesterase
VARRGVWLAAGVAALIGVGFLPAVQARSKALAVLAEAVGAPFPRPFAAEVRRVDTSLGDVRGDLYLPDRPAPAVLLVLGAAPRGPADPRAVRLATSIARAGRVVFAPRLTLAERRFDEQDLDRIVRSVLALKDHPATVGPVATLGISYGGSYALVAAADPRLGGHLAQVATFGAYFDLVGVIQAVSTGASLIDGRRVPWRGHPQARLVLEHHAVQLAPEGSGDELRAVLAGEESPDALDPASRAVFELLANRDPARTPEFADALAPESRALLTRFSPATVASAIDVPVIAMHSTDDPAVPYGELIRLHRALPDARVVTVGSFRHVDLQGGGPGGPLGLVSDLWDAWRFASWLLEAQE